MYMYIIHMLYIDIYIPFIENGQKVLNEREAEAVIIIYSLQKEKKTEKHPKKRNCEKK